MKISIDVDGVLAQFTRGFTQVVNSLWPGKLPFDHEPTDWGYSPELTEQEVSEVWEKVKSTKNFFEHLPPYGENVMALRRFLIVQRALRPLDVYFVTSRVPTAGDSVMKQTQRFLHRCALDTLGCSVVIKPHGISKLEIYHALGIDWSVDDYERNVPDPSNPIQYSFFGTEHNHYLLARPWNASFRARHPQVPIAENLEMFLGKVLASV